MRTVEIIKDEIAQTKEALQNVKGSETEVYARIVGYYRSVKNWNKGKRDEFDKRKEFEVENTSSEAGAHKEFCESELHYEFYSRKTCPNCPPVKNYLTKIAFQGKSIDVDTEEGFAQAASKNIYASPTVIFYDAAGAEVFRANNVRQLDSYLQNTAA